MKEFYTKVVGVTFNNIQSYLPKIRTNDKLIPVFEPENPYDSNAVALFHKGHKIGYFARNIAATLKPIQNIDITVLEITGGKRFNAKKSTAYGCNIFVKINDNSNNDDDNSKDNITHNVKTDTEINMKKDNIQTIDNEDLSNEDLVNEILNN